jgi:hypothetical protein
VLENHASDANARRTAAQLGGVSIAISGIAIGLTLVLGLRRRPRPAPVPPPPEVTLGGNL